MLPIQTLKPEWQKAMKELFQLANKIDYGEVLIKIENGRAVITEYKVKRKITDESAFMVVGILD